MRVTLLSLLCIIQSSCGGVLHSQQRANHSRQLPPLVDSPSKPTPPIHDVRIQLSNYENGQYIGTFTIGGQELPVIYDTGAFGIVVLSDLCHHCRVDGPIYSPTKSFSFDKGDQLAGQHKYENGLVNSKRGLETVRVGNAASPLIGHKVNFWQVLDHDVKLWNKDSKFSGVIGLRLMGGSVPSLLEDVGVTAFSICLGQSAGTSPGWLTMGPSIEQARADSMFKHVPVISNIHWGVQMTSLNIGEVAYDVCSPSCSAVIESGTSQIGAPKAALEALAPVFDRIDPECSNLEDLPDISFNLGAETFVLSPLVYVVKMERSVDEQEKTGKELRCVPNFVEFNMNSKNHGPIWILGIPFLRQYYTVFQLHPKSMHFTQATADCQPSRSRASSDFGHIGTHSTVSDHKQRLRGNVSRVNLPTLGSMAVRLPYWANDSFEKNGTETETLDF